MNFLLLDCSFIIFIFYNIINAINIINTQKMSSVLRKNSQSFKEDIINPKITYLDLIKLDQKTFADQLPNEQEANELLNKLKELKKAIKEKLASMHSKSLENKENQNNNENKSAENNQNLNKREESGKTGFVQLYKRHLKLKDFKDISPVNILTNQNSKTRAVIAVFSISRENLTLRIENILEEGRKHIFVLLKHEIVNEENKKNEEQKEEINYNKETGLQRKEKEEQEKSSGIIFSYDTQNDEEDIFNITQAKNLMNSINLEIMDSRDIAFIMKDLTIAMVRVIEEKFGKRDKNGVDLGITHRILHDIFNIKRPDRAIINRRESDTSNKEADSVQSEKGGYEDDLELEYDDEDQY